LEITFLPINAAAPIVTSAANPNHIVNLALRLTGTPGAPWKET
jgi:hypothetical protein